MSLPVTIGSHGWVYSLAANAWLTGGDPWRAGPPANLFGGPPPMLLPYAITAFASFDVARFGWLVVSAGTAVWALRRLRMPAYWLIFPPLFEVIVLGHPEVFLLAAMALRSPLAGLVMLMKPYAALPFAAERRWTAFVVAAVGGLITLPVLPWGIFVSEFGQIGATIARQSVGDAVFGNVPLMVVAALALASLGLRRALWLAGPVLWPYAQPIYKTMTVPMLPPVIAIAWALPVPGATLIGVVAYALLLQRQAHGGLPAWLREGLVPAAAAFRTQPNALASRERELAAVVA